MPPAIPEEMQRNLAASTRFEAQRLHWELEARRKQLLAELEAQEDSYKASHGVAAEKIGLARNQRNARLILFVVAALIATAGGNWGWFAIIVLAGGIYAWVKSRPIRETQVEMRRLGVSHAQAVSDLRSALAEIDSADAETKRVLHQKSLSW
jgi:hypothetical protein